MNSRRHWAVLRYTITPGIEWSLGEEVHWDEKLIKTDEDGNGYCILYINTGSGGPAMLTHRRSSSKTSCNFFVPSNSFLRPFGSE